MKKVDRSRMTSLFFIPPGILKRVFNRVSSGLKRPVHFPLKVVLTPAEHAPPTLNHRFTSFRNHFSINGTRNIIHKSEKSNHAKDSFNAHFHSGVGLPEYNGPGCRC